MRPSLFLTRQNRTWLTCILMLGIEGCEVAPAPIPVAPPQSPTPTATVQQAAPVRPISESEAQEFGEAMAKAITEKDQPAMERLFPMIPFMERVYDEVGATKRMRGFAIKFSGQHFVSMFSKSMKYRAVLHAEYALLKCRPTDDGPRVILRELSSGGLLNYLEFELGRDLEGSVVATDVYEPFTFGWMSESQAWITAVQGHSKDDMAGARTLDQEIRNHANTFFNSCKSGNTRLAMKAYRQFPEHLRREKTPFLMALQMAQLTNADDYLTMTAEFRQIYPDEWLLDLVDLNHFRVNGLHEAALETLDRLNAAVGDDPYLHVERSNVYVEWEKFSEARQHAETAIAEDPTMQLAYWALYAVALREGSFDDARMVLRKLIEKFDLTVSLDAIRSSPISKAFGESPEFQELSQWYRERTQTLEKTKSGDTRQTRARGGHGLETWRRVRGEPPKGNYDFLRRE